MRMNCDAFLVFIIFGFISGFIFHVIISRNTLKKVSNERDAAKRDAAELSRVASIQLGKAERTLQAATLVQDGVRNIVNEKTKGFPWLSTAISDFEHLLTNLEARKLEVKSRPAPKSAEKIREISRERSTALKEAKILRYQKEYYEHLFPWLVDFLEAEDSAIETDDDDTRKSKDFDTVTQWLSNGEYASLGQRERNQLAYERYRRRHKSNWEIGREYERYIGYIYEHDGWHVHYHGIIAGMEDMGRDLIATKNGIVKIIQCKCWSSDKTIHEKHIFQLYATSVDYFINLRHDTLFPDINQMNSRVRPVFFTTTRLSETAGKAARVLGVEVKDNFPLGDWPQIKCNIRNGAKIYHLPFDKSYNQAKIIHGTGEFYAASVAEAEDAGFRRSFRWVSSD